MLNKFICIIFLLNISQSAFCYIINLQQRHHLSTKSKFNLYSSSENNNKIKKLNKQLDIDERDESWRNFSNRVEYVVGGSSFESLSALGLDTSNISAMNVVPHHLVSGNDLFCNCELNMGQMEAIGFDMDWTLAQYTEEFDLLAYNGAKDKLVTDLGYPPEVMEFVYKQDMSRRGILIDKKRGNFIKMDRHKYVRIALHGTKSLSDDIRKSLYRDTHYESSQFTGRDFASVDTPFSLVDACLYAQLVDLRDKLSQEGSSSSIVGKSYETLWNEMRSCVDRCHKDGVIKLTVAKDPSRYITYDPNIFPMLSAFKESGRKVFLATNSLWDYTQVVMNYLEGRKEGDKRDLEWTRYFDVVIVGAAKPVFLLHDRVALFRVDATTEKLHNIDALPGETSTIKENMEEWLGASESIPKHIFQGGCWKHLHTMLNISQGDRLLYVGDHVYSDVLRSKRTLGWRTCLIVPELVDEVISHKKSRSLFSNLELMKQSHIFGLKLIE